MQFVRISAIVWSDLIRIRRGVNWLWLLGALTPPLMQGQIIKSYISSRDAMPLPPGVDGTHLLSHAVTTTFLLVAPFVVPAWTNIVLGGAHLRDKLSGGLATILATGVSPSTLWSGNLIAAFIGSYLVFLCAIVEGLLLSRFWFHVSVAWSPSLWLAILVFSPLACFIVPAASYLLSWFSRVTQVASGFLPMIIMIGAWLLALRPRRWSIDLITGVNIIGALSILGIAAMACVADFIPRDRIVGIRN